MCDSSEIGDNALLAGGWVNPRSYKVSMVGRPSILDTQLTQDASASYSNSLEFYFTPPFNKTWAVFFCYFIRLGMLQLLEINIQNTMTNQNDSARLITQFDQEVKKEAQELSHKEEELRMLETEADTIKQEIFDLQKAGDAKKSRQMQLQPLLRKGREMVQELRGKLQHSHSELERVRRGLH